MGNSKIIKGYLFAIISAGIYGCMPMMAMYIYDDGVNPMTLVFLRNLLSLPLLALLAYLQSKTLKVPKQSLPTLFIIAIMGCCVTPILLFSSYNFIPSGTATVFHFIYPAAVVVGGIIFLRKNAQPGYIIGVIICIVGVSLFYTPGSSPDLRGSLLALISGLTYSVYVVMLSTFKYKQVTGFLFCFYVTAISTVVMLIVCLATGQMAFPTTSFGWILSVIFSIGITTGAVVLFQQSTFYIGGERTSILSTLEPTTSIFIGVLVFHEYIGPRIFLGSALVILASILIALFDIHGQKKMRNHTE